MTTNEEARERIANIVSAWEGTHPDKALLIADAILAAAPDHQAEAPSEAGEGRDYIDVIYVPAEDRDAAVDALIAADISGVLYREHITNLSRLAARPVVDDAAVHLTRDEIEWLLQAARMVKHETEHPSAVASLRAALGTEEGAK